MSIEIISMETQRAYPPRVTAFTRPFWESLFRGQLNSTRCVACGFVAFPPKPMCPRCWHSEVEWASLPTHGTLYSWTSVHAAPAAFAAEVPYSLCIVDLHDGPRVACRLAPKPGQDPDPEIGDAMQLVALRYSDGVLLGARPSAA